MESLVGVDKASLLVWVRSFSGLADECEKWADLADGGVLLQLLNMILAGTAPNAYTPNEAMLDELAQHTHSNQTWAALADNLTVEYAKLNRHLPQDQFADIRYRNEGDNGHPNGTTIIATTLLILGVAVFGSAQGTYIEAIMTTHDTHVQGDLMRYIQVLMENHYEILTPQSTPLTNAQSLALAVGQKQRDEQQAADRLDDRQKSRAQELASHGSVDNMKVMSPSRLRERLRAERDAALSSSDSLESSPEYQKFKRTHSLIAMEAELTQLRTEVKVLRDKTLNTSLNESFDDSALRDEMDSMRTEMDGMKQQMWAVEAKALESDNRLAEVTKENERLQSALDRVTSEYEMVGAGASKLDRMEKDILHYKRKLEKVKTLETKLVDLEESNKAYVAENLELTQRVKTLSKRADSLLNTSSADMTQAIQEAEAERDDVMILMAEMEEKIEELDAEKKDLLESITDLKDQLEQRDNETTEMEAAVLEKSSEPLTSLTSSQHLSGGDAIKDSLETQRLLSQNNELLRENSVMVANSRQWEKDLHSVYEQLKAKTKELASAKEFGTTHAESVVINKRLLVELKQERHLVHRLKAREKNTQTRHRQEQELVVTAWYNLNLQQYDKAVADYLPGYSAASWLQKQRRMAAEWDAL